MKLSVVHSATWAVLAALTGGCAWEGDAEVHDRYARMQWAAGDGTPAGGAFRQSSADADLRQELPDQAEISDYLRYAAMNNQALEAAFANWKAAVERIAQVKALPDPQLNYRYFIEEVEAQHQGYELMQTFPWFGKLGLRGDAAAAAAAAEWQQYQAAKLRLFYQVKDAYYEYWYVDRAVAVAKENIELLNNTEKVVQVRYAAAAAGQADLIRVQVEQGRLADRLRTLERLRQPVAARLNAALNRPSRALLPPPRDIQEPVASATDEQLLAWLKEHNPQLQALEHEIQRQKHMVDLAKKEYFPDVTLGAGLETSESGMKPNPPDSGKEPVYVMVSLNLPIWYDKLSAGVREAKWQRLTAAYRKADLANTLASDLEMSLYRYQDARFKIDLYRSALLPKALQAQEATDAAFRAGRASFSDLIDTQRVLLEFQLDLARAQADRSQQLAEIEMLVGREVSAPAGSDTPPSTVRTGDSQGP